ncbi:MAG: 4Fe-4S binding protein [Desulfovibrionaceae bacterium]|jgi:2-oxoglutarate ferredoxin oxidoreductase subunit delta|nr:4Fe-4S binding protein [Desulfovibrionaceae bacterium]
MSRVEFVEERCKGCLLCVEACPQEIIVQSERFNQQGYKVAEVPKAKMEQCIGCASCAEVCPDFVISVFRTQKAKPAAKGAKKEGGNG